MNPSPSSISFTGNSGASLPMNRLQMVHNHIRLKRASEFRPEFPFMGRMGKEQYTKGSK